MHKCTCILRYKTGEKRGRENQVKKPREAARGRASWARRREFGVNTVNGGLT